MPIVTKKITELENKKIDSYQNITVVNDLDTMLIINDGSLYSISAQDLMEYIKDHPDIANLYASKKELIEKLNLKIDKTEKGSVSGVAPLNENKKVPSEHILFGKTSGTTYEGSNGKALEDNLNTHKSNFNNPHKIAAATINLGNVDNTSDVNKPVSIATQSAIDTACSNSNGHTETSVSEHNLSATAHETKFNQKLDNTNASTFIKNVSYNSETSVFTFTKYDNTTITIDTPIEEVVNGGYYKEDTQELVLILVSGQEIKIPVTGLIKAYTGETSASIQVVISADNKITANLVGNGVTRILLSTELQTSLTSLETDKHTHPNKSAIDSLTAAKITAWDNKSSFDGNYNSLTNKPTIPNKTSQLSNDSGYLTSGDIETGVTGVKGNSESAYRKGNVNITKGNIDLGNVENVRQYSASNLQPTVAKLATARSINGTPFDGTANISINLVEGNYATFKNFWTEVNKKPYFTAIRVNLQDGSFPINTWYQGYCTFQNYLNGQYSVAGTIYVSDGLSLMYIGNVSGNTLETLSVIWTQFNYKNLKTATYSTTEPTTVGTNEIVYVYE